MAIEIVARAKGSPRIFPIWMPFLLLPYREFSIFLSDGEYKEPKGMWRAKVFSEHRLNGRPYRCSDHSRLMGAAQTGCGARRAQLSPLVGWKDVLRRREVPSDEENIRWFEEEAGLQARLVLVCLVPMYYY
jgi:hypothetical protein